MVEIIEILRQEHRNLEKLLCVMEQGTKRLRSRRSIRTTRSLEQLSNSLKIILTPVIIQRRISFYWRNLRRATPIEQRQFLTLKLSIEKVQCDCVVSLKLSKTF